MHDRVRIWLLPSLAVLFALGLSAGADVASPDELRFPVGESLVYRVYWGKLPVGESRVTTGWRDRDGCPVLYVRMRTRSNRILRALYPVDDTVETLIDPATLLPLRFTKRLNAGRRRYHEVTDFDHAAGIAHWRCLLSDREKEIAIEKDTRDILALMYHLRNFPMVPDQSLEFRVMADEKIYDLLVDVYPPETVNLRGRRRISSFRLHPQAAFEGLFVRSGEAWMWVADDASRLATRVSVDVPVGNVHAVLDQIGKPKRDLLIGPGAAPVDDEDPDGEDGEEEEDGDSETEAPPEGEDE